MFARMTYVMVVALIFVLSTAVVSANSVSVLNTVSVVTPDGGATQGGDGTSEASVFIETMVDGEVVERVDKTAVSRDGVPQDVHKNIYVEREDGDVIVETTIDLHAGSSSSAGSFEGVANFVTEPTSPDESNDVVGSDFAPAASDGERVDEIDIFPGVSTKQSHDDHIQTRSGSVVLATVKALFNFIIHAFSKFFV